jgi:hypothetical protein
MHSKAELQLMYQVMQIFVDSAHAWKTLKIGMQHDPVGALDLNLVRQDTIDSIVMLCT